MHLGVHAVATLTQGKESSVTITRTAVTRPNGFAFQLSVLRPNNSCLLFDTTRFWVQHWVQLIEGRMAFPVRKRRQIGHLAFLLLWLRTRRLGVRVPRVRHSSLKFSITWATLTTEGWSTSWVHWVQQRCFESGTQSQCPPFLLPLCGTGHR